jgi:hypothetical protein
MIASTSFSVKTLREGPVYRVINHSTTPSIITITLGPKNNKASMINGQRKYFNRADCIVVGCPLLSIARFVVNVHKNEIKNINKPITKTKITRKPNGELN